MKKIREYLRNIADNEIINGKIYNERIELKDGGENSYIGISVYTNDWQKEKPVIQGISLFRHSNSVDKLINTWLFELGSVCHDYADNPDIPLKFSSYGITPEQAEQEAEEYFKELTKLIRKRTASYKTAITKNEQKEKAQLLTRLAELEGLNNERAN